MISVVVFGGYYWRLFLAVIIGGYYWWLFLAVIISGYYWRLFLAVIVGGYFCVVILEHSRIYIRQSPGHVTTLLHKMSSCPATCIASA